MSWPTQKCQGYIFINPWKGRRDLFLEIRLCVNFGRSDRVHTLEGVMTWTQKWNCVLEVGSISLIFVLLSCGIPDYVNSLKSDFVIQIAYNTAVIHNQYFILMLTVNVVRLLLDIILKHLLHNLFLPRPSIQNLFGLCKFDSLLVISFDKVACILGCCQSPNKLHVLMLSESDTHLTLQDMPQLLPFIFIQLKRSTIYYFDP